ncbi:TIGR01440 family protein [Paenibacillus turpanensis]|uniref:TIGR01440 family protein n=1 Tax=Paenibacillus turpanensis TaxID=2689078 RepID=UPI00140ADF92|nr:TIGR01440 family protein [Paenibacillus turpanensis]
MANTAAEYKANARLAAAELLEAGQVGRGKLLVIGASTSEVIGKRIGTSGTLEVAAAVYEGVLEAAAAAGCDVAFQCCEHLNRALVLDRAAAAVYGTAEVSAIPVPGAGGAMAAYAYANLPQPCLVEAVRAHAALDIGETLIGMHLLPVAVPFRPSVRYIGEARVTAAYTRPKLIGGTRAVYSPEIAAEKLLEAGFRKREQDC